MRFVIVLKDPDGVYESIEYAVEKEVQAIQGLSDRERERVMDARREGVSDVCSAWIEFGEYIQIEIDTDAKTAKVLELRRR